MEGKGVVMAVIVGVVLVASLQCGVAQTVHVVGDSLGWAIALGGAGV